MSSLLIPMTVTRPWYKGPAGLLILALLLLAVTGGGWYRYTHAPTYALRQLATGFRNRDTLVVRKHLDAKALAQQVTNDVMDHSLKRMAVEQANRADEGGFAAAGTMMGMALAEKMRPAMALTVEAMLDSAIVRGQGAARRDTSSNVPLGLRSLVAAADTVTAFRGVTRTTVEDDTAFVTIALHDVQLDTTLQLTITMARPKGTWRVVGLRNIAAFLDQQQAISKAHLAAVNGDIEQKMAVWARISKMRTRSERIGYFDTWMTISAELTNASDRPLRRAMYKVTGPSLMVSGAREELYLTDDLKPGTVIAPNTSARLTTVMEYNQFMTGHDVIRYTPEAFTLEPRFLVFGDAAGPDTLMRFGSWSEYLEHADHRARHGVDQDPRPSQSRGPRTASTVAQPTGS
jgi:hypothetical protein